MSIPEGYVELDFVGFTDKEDYSSSEIYMKNDLVHWKNTVWKCLSDNTVNIEPGKNNEVWKAFIEGEKPFYGSFDTFPRPGEAERFYVDNTVDPRLMYTWDSNKNDYVLTGGAGGTDGSSIDIPITLSTENWNGNTAPYYQVVTVPQLREEMSPVHYLNGDTDEMRYAYSLITDYETGYGNITFYASDKPTVDISLKLKGIPAQEVEYVDNTVIILIEPSGFVLNETTNRYEQVIEVTGMTAGTGGTWDIVRSGPVLSIAESKIAASITDVDRLDGAVKISCTEVPEQSYMLSLQGTYIGAEEGTTILANMAGWFNKVEELENKVNELNSNLDNLKKQTWYYIKDILGDSFLSDIENKFASAGNYSIFQQSSLYGSEGGWFMFKHDMTVPASGILCSRSNLYHIKRNSNGEWVARIL